MTAIDAAKAKAMLHDGNEIAFLDLREAGEFGEGHPLFAVPCPYSRLELMVEALVPRRDVRVLLIDGGDGVAKRAAQALRSLGYSDISWITGGTLAWADAGYTLFKGVNVPSKTLGELAEHVWHPRMIDAATLAAWQREQRPFHLFDVRPPAEYAKMRVPGAVCLPNGEMAHRFDALPHDGTPVVVTCAGRTRGIVGVIGLMAAGIDAPVTALENGTQGWALAGEPLERGNDAAPFSLLDEAARQATEARADAMRQRFDIALIDAEAVRAWLDDAKRTTYLLDVRSAEEATGDPAPAFTHALSGQLVQASDQWIGVRHARIVLLDDLGLRAAIAAFWLRQLGWEVAVARINDQLRLLPSRKKHTIEPCPAIAADDALRWALEKDARFVDIRGSQSYRAAHVAGAVWGIRPCLGALNMPLQQPILLIADDLDAAALVARDLPDHKLRLVTGGNETLFSAGAAKEKTPHIPSDADAIDFLRFVHDRHDGNLESSRQYLAWEQGLIDQLDTDERSAFKLEHPSAG